MKILLIEDDPVLCRGLEQALRGEGFVVETALKGNDGLKRCDLFAPQLVILDLGLPDISGYEVLKKLRARNRLLPILILTARDRLDDKIVALDGGADDYLCKPFEIAELMARLRVLARRLGTAASSKIEIGPVTVNLSSHQVTIDGENVILTRREFMVLKALMENAGRIQTRDALESKLYGWGEEVSSNTVEVHVSNLRKKLPPDFIQTIRGVGYSIAQKNT